jgi:beta-N-acetylhexosaminidase
MKAVIFGCSGPHLTQEEWAFFKAVQPWGFILFARNCENPTQIRALTEELRASVNRENAPVLIDQEGGRVARLKPPFWRARPAMDRFGALHKINPQKGKEAAFLGSRLLAEDLSRLGINVNCVPILDVPHEGAHDIIGDRALAKSVDDIAELGAQVMAGSIAGGALPIIKHIPGHGRALADSHLELPVVDASLDHLRAVDFAPFKALNQAPMAMTAHVVYAAIDKTRPATISAKVIEEIIRGEIGFDGLLMSDDLSMKALQGSFAERSKATLKAGCDMLLHCNGDMAEMQEIAGASGELEGKAERRAEDALALLADKDRGDFDQEGEEARYARLLEPVCPDLMV